MRQPHWQLICTQRQAFAWHPHVQEEQSHVPQQPVLAIFCEVDVFVSAMVISLDMPTRDCAVTEADGAPFKTLQSYITHGKLPS